MLTNVRRSLTPLFAIAASSVALFTTQASAAYLQYTYSEWENGVEATGELRFDELDFTGADLKNGNQREVDQNLFTYFTFTMSAGQDSETWGLSDLDDTPSGGPYWFFNNGNRSHEGNGGNVSSDPSLFFALGGAAVSDFASIPYRRGAWTYNGLVDAASPDVAPVPLPAGAPLLLISLGGLLALRRRESPT